MRVICRPVQNPEIAHPTAKLFPDGAVRLNKDKHLALHHVTAGRHCVHVCSWYRDKPYFFDHPVYETEVYVCDCGNSYKYCFVSEKEARALHKKLINFYKKQGFDVEEVLPA